MLFKINNAHASGMHMYQLCDAVQQDYLEDKKFTNYPLNQIQAIDKG